MSDAHRTIEPSGRKVVCSGETWYAFLVHYRHRGNEYSTEIFSRSWEEADDMLNSLKHNAEIGGQSICQIPCVPGIGWAVKLQPWIRNMLGVHPTFVWMTLAILFFVLLILK